MIHTTVYSLRPSTSRTKKPSTASTLVYQAKKAASIGIRVIKALALVGSILAVIGITHGLALPVGASLTALYHFTTQHDLKGKLSDLAKTVGSFAKRVLGGNTEDEVKNEQAEDLSLKEFSRKAELEQLISEMTAMQKAHQKVPSLLKSISTLMETLSTTTDETEKEIINKQIQQLLEAIKLKAPYIFATSKSAQVKSLITIQEDIEAMANLNVEEKKQILKAVAKLLQNKDTTIDMINELVNKLSKKDAIIDKVEEAIEDKVEEVIGSEAKEMAEKAAHLLQEKFG